MEKSLNFGSVTHGKIIEFCDKKVLTNYMGKKICMLYVNYSLIFYFSNQAGRLLSISWKTAKSWHKMCKEAMRNMWSCVFMFCDTQNYHGTLRILSWNIIEKSLKIFEAFLWEPCSTLRCACVLEACRSCPRVHKLLWLHAQLGKWFFNLDRLAQVLAGHVKMLAGHVNFSEPRARWACKPNA